MNENYATNEYVTIGDTNYQTRSVTAGLNRISFTLSDMAITDAVDTFKNTTSLTVSGSDLQPYGMYNNLVFNSAAVDAEGLVTVVFHMAMPEEIRLENLEQSQAEQDEAIAQLIFGGDVL